MNTIENPQEHWSNVAASVLLGRKIVAVRYLDKDMTITKIRAAINVGVMFCFLSIIGFCALLMFDAALAALIVGAVLAAIDYTL